MLVFNRQGVLVAHHLDVPSGALTGDPVTVAEAVDYDWGFNLGGFSISTAGRVAYRVGGTGSQLRWFDRAGTPAGVAGEPGASRLSSPELSPDGRHVAVLRDVLNNRDVWLIDLLRGGATRFTSDAAADLYPLWSSDGARIPFSSNRQGIFDLYVKPSSGGSSEELLLESPRTKIPLIVTRRPILPVSGGRSANGLGSVGTAHERRSDANRDREHIIRGAQRSVLPGWAVGRVSIERHRTVRDLSAFGCRARWDLESLRGGRNGPAVACRRP